MKVQCDVCADEAALCDTCDRRVHRANKLAGQHRRFSIHPSSPSPSTHAQAQMAPLCDICQERRGFLFCKEDRAILCRECDVPVHSASEMTRRHNRFLLTGVRLSSAPVDSPEPSSEAEEEEENSNISSPRNDADAAAASASDGSSISEYLTKTLSGWHVEDFLVEDASAGGYCDSDGLYHQGGGQADKNGGGLLREAYTPWTGREQLLDDNVAVVAVTAEERTGRELWVPQMHAAFPGSKRHRASPHPCS